MDTLNVYCVEHIMKFLDLKGKMILAGTNEYYRQLFARWVKYNLSVLDKATVENLEITHQKNLIRLAGDSIFSYHMKENVLCDIVNHCKNLKHLVVNVSYKPDFQTDILFLSKLKSLESIVYDISGVWDITLTIFVKALEELPNLRSLYLHAEGYSGNHLNKLKHIKNLVLYECKNIATENFVAFFKSMKQLQNLYLHGDYGFIYKMYPEVFRAMAHHCDELKYLWLSDITGKCELIADLPKLKGLCYVLNGDSYRNKLFTALSEKKSEQLQCLKLIASEPLKLQNAECIGRIHSLRELSFRLDNIECIEKLNRLNNLEYLTLECSHLSESYALSLISLYPKLIFFGTNSEELTERFLINAFQILRDERKNGLRRNDKLVMGVRHDFENALKHLKMEQSEKYLELASIKVGHTQYTLMDLNYHKNLYKHHHQ